MNQGEDYREERLRRAIVHRAIGFRELNTRLPGEESIRLAVLQRLTQFWSVKLFGQSHHKNFRISPLGLGRQALGKQHYSS